MTGGSPEVQVRLFGPVQVTVGGTPVALNGTRLRTLVAVLAVSAGESVSIETLADRVWGENLPEQIRQSLHAMVFRLRKAIGADVLETVGTSYRLTVPAAGIDVLRFENGLRDAEDANAITAALSAWTERPFVGTDSDWLTGTVLPGLEELRLGAIERSADLLGPRPSTELIAELRRLTADHPLRESLWIRLLRALVHTGRSAEALGLYDVIRSRLADELGIGPGPELQSLHTDLLATDTVLHVTSDAQEPERNEVQIPRSLPAAVPDFLGRERELEILSAADGPLLAAIDGMAGAGKTALALRVAHRLADRYPDGQVFIDLHGYSEDAHPVTAEDALGRLLLAFGVPQRRIPQELEDRSGLLRSLLAQRRVLIVLDNAATEAQVRPLLPGMPGNGVIVTSRLRLTGLDPTATVSVGTLPPATAVELFTRIAGGSASDSPPAVLEAIAEQCGHLPLALRISAARLRTHRSWRPEDLLDRLQHHERLAELTSGPRSVAAALDLSYRELDDDLRRTYRLLGLHPGAEFRTWSAAPLLDLDLATTTSVLERLLDVHLLEEPVPGWYRFHDLVKQHAVRAAAESPDERRTATTRIIEHYCQSAAEASPLHAPDHNLATHGLPTILRTAESARDWLDNELPTALLIPSLAVDRPDCILHLSTSLYWCLRDLGQYDVKAELQQRALTVVRATGDVAAEVDILNRLGEVYRLGGAYRDAHDVFGRARATARTAGYRLGELRAIEGIGNAHGLQDHREAALAELGCALGIAEEIGDEYAQLDLLNSIGWMHARCGDNSLSLEYREQALAIARRVRPRSIGKILAAIGHIQLQCGDPDRALDYYERGLAHAQSTGNRHNELRVLDGLAHVHLELRQLEQATRCRERTMVLARELGSRNWEFEANQGFGRLRLALEEPVEALAAHQRALELATALQQPVDQARAHDGLGDALAALGRLEEARRRWQHALSILQAVGAQTTEELDTSIPRLLSKLAGADVSKPQPSPGPTRVPTK
ncbi:BTAD domain-containing putative transcriptional regulator [Kribbella sp. NPDC048928]|uniref:AfsR/SARP family transcriptional regulator n=1 Tax=Kribbella sp. NPDC048928 TaxID=3364111 RepID=UPI00371F84E6